MLVLITPYSNNIISHLCSLVRKTQCTQICCNNNILISLLYSTSMFSLFNPVLLHFIIKSV